MTISQRLKLLVEWSPVISLATKVTEAKTNHEFSLALIELASFLSTKTNVRFDDDLVGHINAIARSDEGKALIEWIGNVANGLMALEVSDVAAELPRHS